MLHLGALLDAACARWPSRPALTGDGGDFDYAALGHRAAAIAATLRSKSIGADEPVVARVSNRSGDIATFLGIWRAGGVVVPVHRTVLAATLQTVLDRTGARFIVDGDDVSALHQPPPPSRPLLRGAALIIFTSGTTGEPKGVVLSHEAFAGKLNAIDSVLSFTEETRTLLVLQLTFSFGQWVSLLTLARGGTVVMQEKFDAARTLTLLSEQRVNRLGVIPTMLRAMLPVAKTLGRDRVERLFMAGGEPLPAPLGRSLCEIFPQARLCDIFGLTETSTSDFILRADEQDRFPGTIGRPSPQVSFAIHGDDGAPLAHGVPGELVIKTPFIMNGYLDAPELTDAAFRDGYFRTGDMARVTVDGMVELVGRRKELILRAGNKISPIEVERAFLDHPDIADALAVGLPDPRLGEAIHLLIVPSPGTHPTPDALRAWAAQRLDKYKLPDTIHFGTAIPLGRTGKADRGALKAQLLAAKD